MHRNRSLVTLTFLLLPLALWALSGWAVEVTQRSGSVGQAQTQDTLIRRILGQVDKDEFLDIDKGLSGAKPVQIGGRQVTLTTRYTPSEMGTLAEQYVYEYFQSLGLRAYYHEWAGQPGPGSGQCGDLRGRNVIAEIPGKVDPKRIYLLTAHVDSISPSPTTNAPGADDNGSGTTAIMLAAKILRDYSFDYTLRFVTFTGEERGVCGSTQYVSDARARNDDIRGAINLDMIAYDSNGVKDVEIHAGSRQDSQAIANLLVSNIETYKLNLVPHLVTVGATNRSDHASFWQFNYPAILGIQFFLQGDINPYYHSNLCCDTVDHMDLDMATDFTKAGLATIAMLARVGPGSAVAATPAPTNRPVITPTPVPSISIPGSNSQSFPQTGKSVRGLFLEYWVQHGGLPQQGYPISEVIGEVSELDHKPYTVQYFERAVFEYHPQNAPPFNVLLSQLGTFQYKLKYPAPSGAPNQKPNTSAGSVLVPQTNKRMGGRFLEYWLQHGGLMQQGYPISDEFVEKSELDGKEYLVQYFERAVFEYHPENSAPYDVLLSQLGTFQFKQKHSK
jgi:hypothetical protein